MISPSEEEFVMWDFIIRMVTGNMVDPLDETDDREDPAWIWTLSYLCYVVFSPFTCIVSQVQLHLTQTHAIGYYQEFTKRSKKGLILFSSICIKTLNISDSTALCWII